MPKGDGFLTCCAGHANIPAATSCIMIVHDQRQWTVTDHLQCWRHRFVGENGSEQRSWMIGKDKSNRAGCADKRSWRSRVHSVGTDVGAGTTRSGIRSKVPRISTILIGQQRAAANVQLAVWSWEMFFENSQFCCYGCGAGTLRITEE